MIRMFSPLKLFAALILLAGVCNPLLAQQNAPAVPAKYPQAVIRTSMGDIGLELYADKSPASVENFIRYADSGFYEGTIFHRVISHFMIQGGGLTEDMKDKPTSDPIMNEAPNGLSNKRGTVAMARTNNPHSATSQFFINVQDNKNLDYKSQGSSAEWGYAVFGKVISGMDVVESIRFVETRSMPPYSDVPVEPVYILSVDIIAEAPAK
jgi:cyclophilin family peptidyl-prolyl cis-trans isomerase